MAKPTKISGGTVDPGRRNTFRYFLLSVIIVLASLAIFATGVMAKSDNPPGQSTQNHGNGEPPDQGTQGQGSGNSPGQGSQGHGNSDNPGQGSQGQGNGGSSGQDHQGQGGGSSPGQGNSGSSEQVSQNQGSGESSGQGSQDEGSGESSGQGNRGSSGQGSQNQGSGGSSGQGSQDQGSGESSGQGSQGQGSGGPSGQGSQGQSARIAPYVTIVSPPDGSATGEGNIDIDIHFRSSANPNEQPNRPTGNVGTVVLEIDGVEVAQHSNPPQIKEGDHTFSVDTCSYPNGNITLQAFAY